MLDPDQGLRITDFTPGYDPFITEPQNQTFTITYTDVNNNANITWYVDNVRQTAFDNLTRFNWTGNMSQEGTYYIRAVVDDENNPADDVAWTLTVTDNAGKGVLSIMTNLTDMAIAGGGDIYVEVTAICAGGTCDGVTVFMDPLPTEHHTTHMPAYIILLVISSSVILITIHRKYHAQASTEYLIIGGVVLTIAVIAASTYGGISIFGSQNNEMAERAKLLSEEVAITSYNIDENGLHLTLLNNYHEPIRITDISVNGQQLSSSSIPLVIHPSKEKQVSSTTIRSTEANQRFDYPISINYTRITTGAKKASSSGLRLIGETGGAAAKDKGILSNVTAEPFYLIGPANFSCDLDSDNCTNTFQIRSNGASGKYTFYAIASASGFSTANSASRTVTVN
jgi:uncharacterized protein (UPF0333 family)